MSTLIHSTVPVIRTLLPYSHGISNQGGLSGGLRDVGVSFTVAAKKAAGDNEVDGQEPMLVTNQQQLCLEWL